MLDYMCGGDGDIHNNVQCTTSCTAEKQQAFSPSDHREVGHRPADWAVISFRRCSGHDVMKSRCSHTAVLILRDCPASLSRSCHLAVKADHMAFHHAPSTKHYFAALAAGHRYGLSFSVEYQSGFCFRADSLRMVIFSVPNCQGSNQANPHRRKVPDVVGRFRFSDSWHTSRSRYHGECA